MSQTSTKTRPTSPIDTSQPAANLAKSRVQVKARNMLRSVVVRQPVSLELLNQLAFGLITFIVLIGLVVLMFGLGLEIKAIAQSERAVQAQTQATRKAESYLEPYAAELGRAWAEQDWIRAIAILEILHQADADSLAITDRLTHAYVQQGLTLRNKGYIEEALTYFQRALAITPAQIRAQQESKLASGYLAGTQQYQAGQWQKAIDALEAVSAEDKDYVNVKDLLYSAYYNHGLALKAAGEVTQAGQAFETAIKLYPDMAEPQLQIAQIELALTPQASAASSTAVISSTEKIIVVGIAEQQMRVYEGGEQIFDFIVSTGEPGSDTAIGEFEIQNKIDVAYASNWNLDMPYWLGIYWAGPLQNGIHALPTVKHTGYKLWDGYLGQRVSYGCVILGDEDAATLYDWAEVGTKVKIVPSLADWSLGEE
jgi:tetratricopeptide (TPR) repeat protein